jgi:alpha-N-arabinofuranosidase
MLNVHQGATLIPIKLATTNLPGTKEQIPTVSASASRDGAGRIHLSLVNTNPDGPVTVSCTIVGPAPVSVSGRVLTAPSVTSHNSFANPHVVEPKAFDGASLDGSSLKVVLPAASVVVLEL